MAITNYRSILGGLALAVLGSAIWTILGEPTWEWLLKIFVSTAEKFKLETYESLYHDVGRGFNDLNSIKASAISFAHYYITLIIVFFLLGLLNEGKLEWFKTKEFRLFRFFMITMCILLSIVELRKSLFQTYNSLCVTYIERSIEILAPKIEQKEVLNLRAKYRLIDSSDEFKSLKEELIQLSKEHNIILPPF